MANTITTKKKYAVSSFVVKGQKFLVLKKEYLDELLTLIESITVGESLLKKKKTRSFSDFLRSMPKR